MGGSTQRQNGKGLKNCSQEKEIFAGRRIHLFPDLELQTKPKIVTEVEKYGDEHFHHRKTCMWTSVYSQDIA